MASGFSSTAEWYVNGSVQHVGNRFTQPGDQEPGAGTSSDMHLSSIRPPGLRRRCDHDFGSLKLPAYTLVNLSAGVHWDSGLEISVYVNNLFDENPKLSLDRERGLRARLGYNIGQPRTIGLTVRKSFGGRGAPPPPPPPPPPAAAASGDADLPGRIGDPGDRRLPGAAASAAPATAGAGARLIEVK